MPRPYRHVLPKRLERLEERRAGAGLRVFVARAPRARLLGLALMRAPPPGCALLIPRCRSVHTFGMRFALDLVFLDAAGRPIGTARRVPPRRLVRRAEAAAVLEARAGDPAARDPPPAARMIEAMAEDTGSRLAAALDPRRRIYRDPFNEYFVFVLSAAGAAVVVPVTLLVAQALSTRWSVGAFLAVSVVLELLLIFGLGRPQMKPLERVGWALLWGTGAAVLGLCFYYLVVDPLL